MFAQKCWAPCFTLHQSNHINLERGSILIAIYSALLHVLSLFYGIALLTNSVRTDTFYSPFFEFGEATTHKLAITLIVYSIVCIIFCVGLIHGIQSETRFFYLPWLWSSVLELVLMISFGIFMVYRYWYYAWASWAAFILWFYSGYHFYLLWVVISLYYYLQELQEPTFIILYP